MTPTEFVAALCRCGFLVTMRERGRVSHALLEHQQCVCGYSGPVTIEWGDNIADVRARIAFARIRLS